LPNARIRGKISRKEWPKIALRYQNGETLTEIARSYGCTAPAIRYIVARTATGGGNAKTDRERAEKVALLAHSAENRRGARVGRVENRPHPSPGSFPPDSTMTDVWGRINTDIATFLAAMDSLSSDDSSGNYEVLLAATDRLLWATARTRLELERVLANRRKPPSLRRISG
jgi:hypothetical protein